LGQSQLFSIDWSHVATDSGAGVLILDAQGRVLFVNAVAARMYGRRSAREALSARLAELMPQAAAGERLELVRQVIASGEVVQARELWGGWAMRWTLRPVANAAEPGNPGVLIVCSQESALPEDFGEPSVRMVEFKHVDFGPLTGLTASELKVMALIGEGMSNAEIAAKLHRAVKTVESHRAALTEKTGSSSRVQLGIMARRAGLLRRVALNDHETAPAKAVV
jgi:DNA-binding CsgD family transcriptional regulator